MRDKNGNKQQRKFSVISSACNECPVSILNREPQAPQLVKLFHTAKNQEISMRDALGLDECVIEDIQEIFDHEAFLVEKEYDRARENAHSR